MTVQILTNFPTLAKRFVIIVFYILEKCFSSLHSFGTRYAKGVGGSLRSALKVTVFQVTALDTGISINMFYGDPGENVFISKMFKDPYKEHFHYWFLNIIEQNKDQQSFAKILSRLSEVVRHFFIKQWHEVPTEEQVNCKF